MIKCKLRVAYDEDIRSFYGSIVELSENTIVLNISSKDFSENFVKLWVSFHKDGVLNVYEASETGILSGNLILKGLKKINAESEREYHRIDFKGIFSIKKINDQEIGSYRRIVDVNNTKTKSSLYSKIKSLMQTESLQNQVLFKFLMEINNKLDDVLTIIKKETSSDSLTNVYAVDLGGGGLSFFSREQFAIEDKLYLEGSIEESYHKIFISSISKIVNIIKTKKGFFYGVIFDYLEKDIKEDIIKYIFEKDRENIKGTTHS